MPLDLETPGFPSLERPRTPTDRPSGPPFDALFSDQGAALTEDDGATYVTEG